MKKTLLKTQHTVVIGVAGAESGCGVTHFCIGMANYLSNVLGARVALCNIMADPDYRRARTFLGYADNGDTVTFANITFLVNAKQEDLPGISMENDFVILDLSHDFEKYSPIFLRCDKCFFAGALNPWRIQSFINNMLRLKQIYKSKILPIASFGSEKEEKIFKKIVGEAPSHIPFEPDPFCLHKEFLQVMERFFEL